MATLSLLDDCHDCLERGHKSWESYFSKWDLLAENEEAITESGLIEELSDNIDQKKKKKKKAKIQKKSLNSKKLPLNSLLTNKLMLQKKNVTRFRKGKKNPPRKKTQRVQKQTQDANLVESNESLQDDSDNKQLEMNLTTVFLKILEKNKTKWEIFGVLSQIISRGDKIIKTFQDLKFSPMLANEIDKGRCLSSTNQEIVPSIVPVLGNREILFQTSGLDVRLNSFENSRRMTENRNQVLRWNGNQISLNRLNYLRNAKDSTPGYLGKSYLNQSFPVDRFKAVDYVSQSSSLASFYPTPEVSFNNINRFPRESYNGKNLSLSYLNNFQNENEKRLKPPPLVLGRASEGSEVSNININKLSFLKARFSNVPEMNIPREKTFQNLCLHKRTSDVTLNMGNSNFVTPKRKPSERKCFSENILQRKKRCPSKLSFFDYGQDDSDSDDQSESRSPIIRWESKKRKIEMEEETNIENSDSDDLDIIFERVRKP